MSVRRSETKPAILAEARFSRDMAATLEAYFEAYEVAGVVTVEVTDHGLWLKNPFAGRQFLGSTTLFGVGQVN